MSAGAVSSCLAQQPSPDVQRSFPLAEGGTVRLENSRGPVTVVTGPPGVVAVRAWTGGPVPSGDPPVRFDAAGGDLRITSRVEGTSVRFELTVPPSCELVLRTGEGNLSVDGVLGGVRMETDSGDLTARDCGQVAAGSVNGDIVIEACRSGEANTVSGTIEVRRVEGPVTATCVSGSIVIEEVASSSVRASTTGGDIRFLGPVLQAGAYRLYSHSGDITFTARGGVGFSLSLSTFSGSIAVPLDIILTTAPISRRSLTGVWGEASASVELKAFSGDIRLEASPGR